MREFKDLKITVAGTGYVGLSIATLLAQHHQVTAIDIIPEKVELINQRKSPIQDEYIEKYLAEKELDLTATLDAEAAYTDADFVVIAAPTNYDSKKNFFDSRYSHYLYTAGYTTLPGLVGRRTPVWHESHLRCPTFPGWTGAGIYYWRRFYLQRPCSDGIGRQYFYRPRFEQASESCCGERRIAPNGINLKSKQAEVDTAPIVGTFIGRYSLWQKGLDLLLSAVQGKKALLEKSGIQIRLYGPNDRSSSPDAVKKIVSEKGLEGIVSVNGSVFDEEKERVLLNSSFFIHTSRFEGMPMSVLDALSYGIPCLVTQGSNMRESIDEFNAGWGADNSVDSIEVAFENLCSTIYEFREKGENAYRLAAKYTWDFIAKDCHDV